MFILHLYEIHDFTYLGKLSPNTIVSLNFHSTLTFLLNRLGIRSSFIEPIFVKCLLGVRAEDAVVSQRELIEPLGGIKTLNKLTSKYFITDHGHL